MMTADLSATLSALRRLARGRPPVVSRSVSVTVVAACAVGGFFAAPPIIEPLNRAAVTHWGGWPLETAFSGAVLVACLITFRVLEVIFRAHDAGALLTLPLSALGYGLDRLRASLLESLLLSLGVLAFIAPSLGRPGGVIALLAAVYVLAAAVVVPAIAFATVVIAGVAALDPRSLAARVAGGTASEVGGGVYHLAPGAAFAASAATLLLMKLGFEEPARTYAQSGAFEFTTAAAVALGAPLLGVAIALGYALSAYAKTHDALHCRFSDAELHRTETGYNYFDAEASGSRRQDRGVDVVRLAMTKKDRLQLARATPFLRVGSWLVAAIVTFMLWASGETVGGVTVGLLLSVWLVAVVAPLRRLGQLPGESRYGLADMLAPAPTRRQARRSAAAAEIAVHAAPLAFAGVGGGLKTAAVVGAIVIVAAAGLVVAPRLAGRGRLPQAAVVVLGVAAVAGLASRAPGAALLLASAAALLAAALMATRPRKRVTA